MIPTQVNVLGDLTWQPQVAPGTKFMSSHPLELVTSDCTGLKQPALTTNIQILPHSVAAQKAKNVCWKLTYSEVAVIVYSFDQLRSEISTRKLHSVKFVVMSHEYSLLLHVIRLMRTNIFISYHIIWILLFTVFEGEKDTVFVRCFLIIKFIHLLITVIVSERWLLKKINTYDLEILQ